MSRLRVQAQYGPLAARLPALVSELARAVSVESAPDRVPAAGLLTLALRAADGLAYKYGYLDLSARIIDVMRGWAEMSSDPLLRAMTAYVRTENFFVTGDLNTASRLLVAAADELPVRVTEPAATSASFGALHMRAAVVAARRGKADLAQDHLNEARRSARRVPEAVYLGTAFGPASVRIHELAVAVELGDSPAAVERAALWHPSASLPAERRSHYYIDLGRAELSLGHYREAWRSIYTAKQIAPEHVREHPQVRSTLAGLLRANWSGRDQVREFANWANVS